MNRKRLYITGTAAILACIICFALIYVMLSPKPAEGGQKSYILEVSDGNNIARYSGKTDALYLSGLMDELEKDGNFSYETADGPYGIYITSVNGSMAADSSKAGWIIYVNGEFGQYGADTQPVNDGDSFALKLESYE